MLGRQGDADAGADIDLVAVYVEWLRDNLDDTIGKRARGFALVGLVRLNDGELVAAEPASTSVSRKSCLEPRRDLPQQGIAGGMAERIVDVLEPVEVQQQDA